MARISIDDSVLTIALSPVDKFFALHGNVRIPIAHVTGAVVEDENGWNYLWKLMGTSLPGIKVAGSFFTSEGLAFCDFGNGKNCVVISTSHEMFKRVAVQLDADQDAREMAGRIASLAVAPPQ